MAKSGHLLDAMNDPSRSRDAIVAVETRFKVCARDCALALKASTVKLSNTKMSDNDYLALDLEAILASPPIQANNECHWDQYPDATKGKRNSKSLNTSHSVVGARL